MKINFGSTVRSLRTKRGIGLRKFAREVGISPTYLSKIERGEFPPPAEDKIVTIAAALEQDLDVMLALAGRVSTDLGEAIRRYPQELGALLRASAQLGQEEISHLTRQAQAAANGGGAVAAEMGAATVFPPLKD